MSGLVNHNSSQRIGRSLFLTLNFCETHGRTRLEQTEVMLVFEDSYWNVPFKTGLANEMSLELRLEIICLQKLKDCF